MAEWQVMSTKLDPDGLVERTRVFDVDELTFWVNNPNQGDTSAIARSVDEFGQIDTILVCGGVVVSGTHRVLLERQTRQFGGRLAGVDVTDLGWDDARRVAAALALNRTARLGHDDPALMGQAIAGIVAQATDVADRLLDAMSLDEDYLARLLADVKPLRFDPQVTVIVEDDDAPPADTDDLPASPAPDEDPPPGFEREVTVTLTVPAGMRRQLVSHLRGLQNRHATWTIGEALVRELGIAVDEEGI